MSIKVILDLSPEVALKFIRQADDNGLSLEEYIDALMLVESEHKTQQAFYGLPPASSAATLPLSEQETQTAANESQITEEVQQPFEEAPQVAEVKPRRKKSKKEKAEAKVGGIFPPQTGKPFILSGVKFPEGTIFEYQPRGGNLVKAEVVDGHLCMNNQAYPSFGSLYTKGLRVKAMDVWARFSVKKPGDSHFSPLSNFKHDPSYNPKTGKK